MDRRRSPAVGQRQALPGRSHTSLSPSVSRRFSPAEKTPLSPSDCTSASAYREASFVPRLSLCNGSDVSSVSCDYANRGSTGQRRSSPTSPAYSELHFPLSSPHSHADDPPVEPLSFASAASVLPSAPLHAAKWTTEVSSALTGTSSLPKEASPPRLFSPVSSELTTETSRKPSRLYPSLEPPPSLPPAIRNLQAPEKAKRGSTSEVTGNAHAVLFAQNEDASESSGSRGRDRVAEEKHPTEKGGKPATTSVTTAGEEETCAGEKGQDDEKENVEGGNARVAGQSFAVLPAILRAPQFSSGSEKPGDEASLKDEELTSPSRFFGVPTPRRGGKRDEDLRGETAASPLVCSCASSPCLAGNLRRLSTVSAASNVPGSLLRHHIETPEKNPSVPEPVSPLRENTDASFSRVSHADQVTPRRSLGSCRADHRETISSQCFKGNEAFSNAPAGRHAERKEEVFCESLQSFLGESASQSRSADGSSYSACSSPLLRSPVSFLRSSSPQSSRSSSPPNRRSPLGCSSMLSASACPAAEEPRNTPSSLGNAGETGDDHAEEGENRKEALGQVHAYRPGSLSAAFRDLQEKQGNVRDFSPFAGRSEEGSSSVSLRTQPISSPDTELDTPGEASEQIEDNGSQQSEGRGPGDAGEEPREVSLLYVQVETRLESEKRNGELSTVATREDVWLLNTTRSSLHPTEAHAGQEAETEKSKTEEGTAEESKVEEGKPEEEENKAEEGNAEERNTEDTAEERQHKEGGGEGCERKERSEEREGEQSVNAHITSDFATDLEGRAKGERTPEKEFEPTADRGDEARSQALTEEKNSVSEEQTGETKGEDEWYDVLDSSLDETTALNTLKNRSPFTPRRRRLFLRQAGAASGVWTLHSPSESGSGDGRTSKRCCVGTTVEARAEGKGRGGAGEGEASLRESEKGREMRNEGIDERERESKQSGSGGEEQRGERGEKGRRASAPEDTRPADPTSDGPGVSHSQRERPEEAGGPGDGNLKAEGTPKKKTVEFGSASVAIFVDSPSSYRSPLFPDQSTPLSDQCRELGTSPSSSASGSSSASPPSVSASGLSSSLAGPPRPAPLEELKKAARCDRATGAVNLPAPSGPPSALSSLSFPSPLPLLSPVSREGEKPRGEAAPEGNEEGRETPFLGDGETLVQEGENYALSKRVDKGVQTPEKTREAFASEMHAEDSPTALLQRRVPVVVLPTLDEAAPETRHRSPTSLLSSLSASVQVLSVSPDLLTVPEKPQQPDRGPSASLFRPSPPVLLPSSPSLLLSESSPLSAQPTSSAGPLQVAPRAAEAAAASSPLPVSPLPSSPLPASRGSACFASLSRASVARAASSTSSVSSSPSSPLSPFAALDPLNGDDPLSPRLLFPAEDGSRRLGTLSSLGDYLSSVRSRLLLCGEKQTEAREEEAVEGQAPKRIPQTEQEDVAENARPAVHNSEGEEEEKDAQQPEGEEEKEERNGFCFEGEGGEAAHLRSRQANEETAEEAEELGREAEENVEETEKKGEETKGKEAEEDRAEEAEETSGTNVERDPGGEGEGESPSSFSRADIAVEDGLHAKEEGSRQESASDAHLNVQEVAVYEERPSLSEGDEERSGEDLQRILSPTQCLDSKPSSEVSSPLAFPQRELATRCSTATGEEEIERGISEAASGNEAGREDDAGGERGECTLQEQKELEETAVKDADFEEVSTQRVACSSVEKDGEEEAMEKRRSFESCFTETAAKTKDEKLLTFSQFIETEGGATSFFQEETLEEIPFSTTASSASWLSAIRQLASSWSRESVLGGGTEKDATKTSAEWKKVWAAALARVYEAEEKVLEEASRLCEASQAFVTAAAPRPPREEEVHRLASEPWGSEISLTVEESERTLQEKVQRLRDRGEELNSLTSQLQQTERETERRVEELLHFSSSNEDLQLLAEIRRQQGIVAAFEQMSSMEILHFNSRGLLVSLSWPKSALPLLSSSRTVYLSGDASQHWFPLSSAVFEREKTLETEGERASDSACPSSVEIDGVTGLAADSRSFKAAHTALPPPTPFPLPLFSASNSVASPLLHPSSSLAWPPPTKVCIMWRAPAAGLYGVDRRVDLAASADEDEETEETLSSLAVFARGEEGKSASFASAREHGESGILRVQKMGDSLRMRRTERSEDTRRGDTHVVRDNSRAGRNEKEGGSLLAVSSSSRALPLSLRRGNRENKENENGAARAERQKKRFAELYEARLVTRFPFLAAQKEEKNVQRATEKGEREKKRRRFVSGDMRAASQFHLSSKKSRMEQKTGVSVHDRWRLEMDRFRRKALQLAQQDLTELLLALQPSLLSSSLTGLPLAASGGCSKATDARQVRHPGPRAERRHSLSSSLAASASRRTSVCTLGSSLELPSSVAASTSSLPHAANDPREGGHRVEDSSLSRRCLQELKTKEGVSGPSETVCVARVSGHPAAGFFPDMWSVRTLLLQAHTAVGRVALLHDQFLLFLLRFRTLTQVSYFSRKRSESSRHPESGVGKTNDVARRPGSEQKEDDSGEGRARRNEREEELLAVRTALTPQDAEMPSLWLHIEIDLCEAMQQGSLILGVKDVAVEPIDEEDRGFPDCQRASHNLLQCLQDHLNSLWKADGSLSSVGEVAAFRDEVFLQWILHSAIECGYDRTLWLAASSTSLSSLFQKKRVLEELRREKRSLLKAK
ncbi:UNVERIFIED_CONTAM: hypothetical protein HHA_277940 [Hammondia hammondi]|eukprot:XP_008887068.1 hypothetical protein HHA_277940 [Hammondia hammondi]